MLKKILSKLRTLLSYLLIIICIISLFLLIWYLTGGRVSTNIGAWLFNRNMIHYFEGWPYFPYPDYLHSMTIKQLSFFDWRSTYRLWRAREYLEFYGMQLVTFACVIVTLYYIIVYSIIIWYLIFDKSFRAYVKISLNGASLMWFIMMFYVVVFFLFFFSLCYFETSFQLADLHALNTVDVNMQKFNYDNLVTQTVGFEPHLKNQAYRFSSFNFKTCDFENKADVLRYNRYCSYHELKIDYYKSSDSKLRFFNIVSVIIILTINRSLSFLLNIHYLYGKRKETFLESTLKQLENNRSQKITKFLSFFLNSHQIHNFLDKLDNKKWRFFFSMFGISFLEGYRYVTIHDYFILYTLNEEELMEIIFDDLDEYSLESSSPIWNFIIRTTYHSRYKIPEEHINTDKVDYSTRLAKWRLFFIKIFWAFLILIIIIGFIFLVLGIVQYSGSIDLNNYLDEKSLETFWSWKKWYHP